MSSRHQTTRPRWPIRPCRWTCKRWCLIWRSTSFSGFQLSVRITKAAMGASISGALWRVGPLLPTDGSRRATCCYPGERRQLRGHGQRRGGRVPAQGCPGAGPLDSHNRQVLGPLAPSPQSVLPPRHVPSPGRRGTIQRAHSTHWSPPVVEAATTVRPTPPSRLWEHECTNRNLFRHVSIKSTRVRSKLLQPGMPTHHSLR